MATCATGERRANDRVFFNMAFVAIDIRKLEELFIEKADEISRLVTRTCAEN